MIVNVHTVISDPAPDPLGRRLLHDSRSAVFDAKPQGISVRHPMLAPHVDQFYLSGCVGFSTINLLNCVMAAHSRKIFNQVVRIGRSGFSYLGNDDGIRAYHETTLRDPFPGEYPPVDEGSSAIGVMKWLKEIGVIKSYGFTRTFDAFLAALERQPVLVGINWYDDMMSTEAGGIVRSTATGAGGGHEFCATQIIRKLQLIGCEQSWGQNPPGFGNGYGRFFLPFELAEELIINQQGDVAVPELL